MERQNIAKGVRNAGLLRVMRAANDNGGGRRVVVHLMPTPPIAVAEVEVFGALVAELRAEAANDNHLEGAA